MREVNTFSAGFRLYAQSNLWSANLRYRTSTIPTMDIGSSLRRTSDLNQNPKLPSHPLLFGLTLPFSLSLPLSLSLSLSTFDSHPIFGAEWTRRSHPRIPYNNASLIRHVCSAAEYTIVAATVLKCFDSVKRTLSPAWQFVFESPLFVD